MAKDIKIGKWSSTPEDIYGNVDGGFPLVVFNSAMDTALMLSPASTFMSANQYSFKDDQTGETVLTFGPMSSIDEVIMIVHIQICCRGVWGWRVEGVQRKSTSFYQGGDLGDNSTLICPESPSLLTLPLPCINLFIFHLMYDVNTL